MSPWGKLLGCAAGLTVGGLPGAIFGLGLGHAVDVGVVSAWRQAREQDDCFDRLFSLLGYLAKSDGRVSEAEVAAVQRLFEDLRLSEKARLRAVDAFNQGRKESFNAERALDRLARVARPSPVVTRFVIDCAIRIAIADGWVRDSARGWIKRMAARLGVNPAVQEVRLEQAADGAADSGPYAALDLRPEASNSEVRRAYRRLMSRHHPDKLMGQGVRGEALALAEARVREVRKAYETICRERGI